MSQVMDRVKVSLGQQPSIDDPAKARQQVDGLIQEYIAAAGDSHNIMETYKLLDLEDDGIQTISNFIANAKHGLEPDQGREFFTEAQDSTNKIIDDLTQTGRARIVGPDGKLYDMELIAVDADEEVKEMPDCLSMDVSMHVATGQQFNLAGTYAIGDGNGVLPNVFHGEIIAESELASIQTALNGDSDEGREDYAGFSVGTVFRGPVNYKFKRTDGDNPIFAKLPPAYRDLARSTAGAYLIEYHGVGNDATEKDAMDVVSTTAWYANHRTAQWEMSKRAQAGASPAPDGEGREPVQPVPTNVPNVPEAPPTAVDPSPSEDWPSGPFDGSGALTESKPPEPKKKTKAALKVKPAPSGATETQAASPATLKLEDYKMLHGLFVDRMKQLQELQQQANRARANRREIYNSVINYLGYAIPRSLVGNVDPDALGNLTEFGSGEDSYGKVQGEYSTLFALSDGMGGAAHGATASRLTIEAFLNDIGLTKILDEDNTQDVINRAVLMMQKRIVAARKRVVQFNRERHSDSGATVVAAEVIGDKLVYGSVGDSAIFVVRNDKFILAAGDRGGHGASIYNAIGGGLVGTDFESMPGHLLKENTIDELSRAERAGNPFAKDKLVEISKYDDVGVFELQDGDRVVMCSDGVMGDWSEIENLSSYRDTGEQTLTDEQIVAATGNPDINQAMVALMQAAKKVDDRSVQMFDVRLYN